MRRENAKGTKKISKYPELVHVQKVIIHKNFACIAVLGVLRVLFAESPIINKNFVLAFVSGLCRLEKVVRRPTFAHQ